MHRSSAIPTHTTWVEWPSAYAGHHDLMGSHEHLDAADHTAAREHAPSPDTSRLDPTSGMCRKLYSVCEYGHVRPAFAYECADGTVRYPSATLPLGASCLTALPAEPGYPDCADMCYAVRSDLIVVPHAPLACPAPRSDAAVVSRAGRACMRAVLKTLIYIGLDDGSLSRSLAESYRCMSWVAIPLNEYEF